MSGGLLANAYVHGIVEGLLRGLWEFIGWLGGLGRGRRLLFLIGGEKRDGGADCRNRECERNSG
jgi:hypothetical protein